MLQVEHVSKAYRKVKANDDVSFWVETVKLRS